MGTQRFQNWIRMGLLAAGGLIVLPLVAQEHVTWVGTTGAWSDPTNWTGNQLPGADDTAGITNNGTAQVEVGDNFTVDQLGIGEESGVSGTLSITGGAITATNTLVIGDISTGVLNLSGTGTLTSDIAYVGATNEGTANMSGGTWTLTERLIVGVFGGTGTVNMSGGALTTAGGSLAHSNTTATGTLNLSGGTWSSTGDFYVGRRGNGTLNLSDTGTLTVNDGAGTITLGDSSGSTGTLNLTSGNATLNAAAITGGAGAGTVVLDSNSGITLNASLSGSLALEINQGVNTLVGDSTHTGATTVNAGTLLNNGSFGSTAVIVAEGATVGGTGSFGGLVTLASGAILAPGASPGTITFEAGLTLSSDTFVNFELGTMSDLIVVSSGALTGPLSGLVTLNFSEADGFDAGDYTLFNYTGATLDDFDLSDFTIGTGISGYDITFLTIGDTLVARTALTAVPEPSTYAAILGGLALGFVVWRRRRGA